MYAAADTDLKASLMLADEKYEAVKLSKQEKNIARRKSLIQELEKAHALEERQ